MFDIINYLMLYYFYFTHISKEENMPLPKAISGAQEKILCFDNIGRMSLQAKVLQILSSDDGVEMEIRQINYHLGIAFDYADLVFDRLQTVNPQLAEMWRQVFTGHNISYPLFNKSGD